MTYLKCWKSTQTNPANQEFHSQQRCSSETKKDNDLTNKSWKRPLQEMLKILWAEVKEGLLTSQNIEDSRKHISNTKYRVKFKFLNMVLMVYKHSKNNHNYNNLSSVGYENYINCNISNINCEGAGEWECKV